MLIQNYGLFWRRKSVVWGKGGHLKGVDHRALNRSDPVDFRQQGGVYVLYDENFRLVYVGQAGVGSLFRRLKQHQTDDLADRWTRFSWFGVRGVTERGTLTPISTHQKLVTIPQILDHIEAILISAAEPPQNSQDGRFGKNVTRYLQYRDEDLLGKDMETMVKEIWERSLRE